ncbi:hypothetical protein [Burkholderia multivorans]|uniref:hypothetical protein n=1 Tax=Burkholderia multivorans TaxID=87883 RepID=UPI0021C1313D|nr:hypothetical protein [Burkholderia multivorans]
MSHGDWDKDLVSMRTRYWARKVKETAGFGGKKDQDFIDACKYGNTKLVELGGMTWAGYLSGKNNPVNKTVDAVEKVLPGTALNFYKGPNDIELWKVLAEDVKEAEALLDSALKVEHGHTVNDWDLAQKVFWFILPILAFPVAPFVAQMVQEGEIQAGEELPWSDIQSLIDRGVINPPMDGGEIFLSSLLAVCDDTRKIYTLDNTFSTFGPRLINYAYEHYKQWEDLEFSATFIVTALGLLSLAENASNNRLMHIAKTLISGLTHGAIEDEFPDVEELAEYVKRQVI